MLLIGDSITKAYYGNVRNLLRGKAYVARLATSALVADPIYYAQLDAAMEGYNYDVIHINNGLHGMDYTEQEYAIAYKDVIKYIRKKNPKAELIIALTTPLNPKSREAKRNPRMDERNKAVKAIAKEFDLQVNDLHTPMVGHTEYYKDPYHYKPAGVKIQSKLVAEAIKPALSN